ncbi:hypothetical protein BsWGS_07478 [Bradybaena similaris]
MSRAFASTTTLSSNTESSDEADDVFNVVLRVRPLNAQERGRRDKSVIEYPGDGLVAVSSLGSKRNFKFNTVFEQHANQEEVFEKCGIKKLIEAAFNGFTCTAFAFGQTGSGKTHTMTGPPAQFYADGGSPDPRSYGIIQRSFKYLFQLRTQQPTHKVIRASYLEIYNEQVIDLLNNSQGRYLSVRWSKNKGFYVENLFTVVCQTADDLMAVLHEGLRNRQNGSHGLNEFSSRSHSVLTVTIDSERRLDPEEENLYITNKGKLSFVDLAGSEKVKDSGTGGPGILESNSINKSLLVLGNCISHLGDSRRRLGHIPYRDSKLTKLLSDSLAGNGMALMIACITPSSANVTETVNTLRYASRAKRIKTKPTVKLDPRETLIVTLKREIRILRQENHYLRQQLDFPAKPKGQLQKENDEQFLKFMKQQEQKETGLYEMLQEYMVENESLRSENSQLHTVKDSMRREQQALHDENESLSQRVEQLERLLPQLPATWATTSHQRTHDYSQWDPPPVGSLPHIGYVNAPHRPAIRSNDLPNGVGKFTQGSPVAQAQPARPPHRLTDHMAYPAPRPAEYIEATGHIDSYTSPRHTAISKPTAFPPRHKEGQHPLSQTDLTRGMNEKLLQEVMQLDGEIQQHTRTAHAAKHTSKDFYR